MPSGKIALQSGKPVLMTDQNFFDCCCWDCGSTITVQVCCASGVYSAFGGWQTLSLVTSYGAPYYFLKQVEDTSGGGSVYQYVVVKDATLGWVLVLRILVLQGQTLFRGGYSWPYDVPYIRLRAASGYAGDCPRTSTSDEWFRHACEEATWPSPPNKSTCACSINTDIMAFVGVSAQAKSCTAPVLSISSAAIPDADQGVSNNFTFTVTDPNQTSIYFSVDWGDGTSSTATATGCFNYVVIAKTYNYPGNYTITATAKTSSTGTVIDTETASIAVARVFNFDECDKWFNANSGGYGGTDDTWNIPTTVVSAGTPIDIRFEAYSIPDRFLVYYDQNDDGTEELVYDSLWRGTASYVEDNPTVYRGTYPDNYGGTGSGEALGIFNTVSGRNSFRVVVEGPASGTAWNYDIRADCP